MYSAEVHYLKKDIIFTLICENLTQLHELIDKFYPFEIISVEECIYKVIEE